MTSALLSALLSGACGAEDVGGQQGGEDTVGAGVFADSGRRGRADSGASGDAGAAGADSSGSPDTADAGSPVDSAAAADASSPADTQPADSSSDSSPDSSADSSAGGPDAADTFAADAGTTTAADTGPDVAPDVPPACPTGAACDDGDACTGADACQGGKCVGGQPKVCDDGNPCTKDACLPASGCTATDDDGASCDDNNLCTLVDHCAAGACKPGKLKSCDDGLICTVDTCETASGVCLFNKQTYNGLYCEDGSVCTAFDQCKDGVCLAGEATQCDDGDVCTDDSCDAKKGCVYADGKLAVACDDGDKCTAADVCAVGVCKGKPLACGGPTGPCVAAVACKPETGLCTPKAAPDGLLCEDGNKCTQSDKCVAGKCVAGPSSCGEVTLEPIADTWVYAGSSGSNYGSSAEIYVGQSFTSTSKRHGYLKFDLKGLPSGAKVEAAELSMTAFRGYAWGNDGNVYTHFVSDDGWGEKTLNWGNKPTAAATPIGKWWLWYNHQQSDKVGTNKDPLLVKQVQTELAGDKVLSLRLHSPGYETRYRSREYSDKAKRPKLYIKYVK